MTKKALLIIDVQNGMFQEENIVYRGNELLDNLRVLINQARSSNVPVFYVQHNTPAGKPLEYGSHGWKVHRDITPENGDVVIQKSTPDSFFKTNLDYELKIHDVNHLVITGIQTEVCVDTACRRAFSKGYKVTLVSDAHSTWSANGLNAQQIIDHHNGTLRWFARVTNHDEVRL
ncbi:nicotinamidase-related amidase [Alkalibacillus filiformis]|uniref:Nicotinamidase-related amidase n=1 Tax=Alkalibacillus filiformis TaxID=200990 RepID=A0ABU0DTE9_9BACI|nr:cysteine hydrolase family protein [Alkalibacillus filiformis]MDQ0351702.1 nicotinamidase-related amidase [Alkalibacillus filiformis]